MQARQVLALGQKGAKKFIGHYGKQLVCLRHRYDDHRRSLAGTQVFRFKTIFGDRPQSRQIDNQFKEILLKSAILNRMTHLGMPDSVKGDG